ncbi:formylmethanofuran dehydrogenase subunit E family protein [Stigmatella sp. ncwal1]|uniref:Formylmethanofuran dehydrogenase subunit E family protein n=1 Tax=Stigmatella ashevillensis TaxID=2995309 RepID=A0ABT5DLH9_9BACT|nr:formylmethanofuran dehydrogenase subunit E family protein [Stigmatella ashevillena]MDC0714396.1 formylmethanofuran dehydrogenase subunit E family protein [Stigmatella ashevillena]
MPKHPRRLLCPLVMMLMSAACTGAHHASPHGSPALERVAAVHGGAGPWAVAGYRMGEYALRQLGLPAGSFQLEVVHHSPAQVQYACVADGAAAATGASLGKLNLSRLDVASAEEVATTFRNRNTGQSITLRPARTFAQRYLDVPREKLAETGREVLSLPEPEIFEAVTQP